MPSKTGSDRTTKRLVRLITIAAALAFLALAPGASAIVMRTPHGPAPVDCHETDEGITCDVCARRDRQKWPFGESHDEGLVVWVAIGPDPNTFKAGYTDNC